MNPNRETILLDALNERYRALAVIRERVQTVALWVLGIVGTATGWIVMQNPTWSNQRRLLISITAVVILAVLRFRYFPDLHKGFMSQQKVAVGIETELGLYKPGALNESGKGDAIYPDSWQKAGETKGNGRFFASNYLLLYISTILLLVAIWTTGC